MEKIPTVWLIVVGFLLIMGSLYWFWVDDIHPYLGSQNRIACTQEAKQCLDGSYVGRTSPRCEFAECPKISGPEFKNFKNATLGYSMNYPADYFYHATDDGDCFQAYEGGNDGPIFCVSFFDNPQTLTPSQWVASKKLKNYLIEGSSIAVAGIPALYFGPPPDGFPESLIVFSYKNKMIVINGGTKFDDEILSSFRFIEMVDTSTWKTYRNEKYEFEVKYPDFSQNRIGIKENEYGYDHVTIEYFSEEENQFVPGFQIAIKENKELHDLTTWFNVTVDKTNSLIANGNFVLRSVPGGGQMYALEKVPPSDAYLKSDEGPICDDFLMSPSRRFVFVMNCPGGETGLHLFGDEKTLMAAFLSSFGFINTGN